MFTFCNNVVLRLTRSCNLSCSYCYLLDKNSRVGEFMDIALYRKIIDKIIEDRLKVGKVNSIGLNFYGGEPTLIGLPVLSEMFAYAKDRLDSVSIPVHMSIQTNGTLIDRDTVRVFKTFNVSVGISFDGVKNGFAFATKTTETTDYERIYSLFAEEGLKAPSIITVVSKQNVDSYTETEAYIHNVLGVDKAQVNLVEDVPNTGHLEVKGAEYFDKVMKSEVDKYALTRSFDSIELGTELALRKYMGLPVYRGSCFKPFCGSGISLIDIDPDGSVNFCGVFASKKNESRIGNSLDEDLFNRKQIGKFIRIAAQKRLSMIEVACQDCEAVQICDKGCMAFCFAKTGKWGIRPDTVCSRNKALWAYIESIGSIEKGL